MQKGVVFARLVLAMCLALLALAAFGQSVTISPSNPTLVLGGSVTFTAKVTGLSSLDVKWSINGKSNYGTITSKGVYTAPTAMPPQMPVTVTATSKVNSKVSASTNVNLLYPAPKITSVSPNPLPVGNYTVTITGSGFLTGATVINTSNNSPIQLVTNSVTSTQITAGGYQAPAPTAAFKVRNPGSAYSNSITVPVTSNQPKYTLTVKAGSGSGSYTAGAVVSILANTPPAGEVFQDWSGATVANPTAASTTLTMPASSTTVTANFGVPGQIQLTVVNGSGSGTYPAGKVVTISANAAPAGETFSDWTGATVANAAAPTTTLTMPSSSTTVTANYTNAPTIPYPVTTHPRLWINSTDVPRLQSWASSSNPVYTQGIVPLLATAVNDYTTQYFPNGVQNPSYPDLGDSQGYTGLLTEQDGVVLALNALIDPVPANRIKYAQYARNILMVALDQAALGHLANAPFRDPSFAIYNRAGEGGAQWPLIVDWLYDMQDASGNPILSATDKATIRKAFMIWANDCLNAETTGGDHPSPVGVVNSLQLLPNSQPYRMAANNYYLGHARLLTMMALCIDPSDDPKVNPSQADSVIGNTLRSYILDATGAWLYQEYAMFGDPSTVATAYDIPSKGLGLASGGLPPEGFLYGLSFGAVFEQLLALQTSGFNNVSYSGPQINLTTAPVWDRYIDGFLSSLTPTAQVPAGASYIGPIYQFANYGDLLELAVTPDNMAPFALKDLLDHENGNTSNDNAVRWLEIDAMQGGAAALDSRVSNPWTWGCLNAVLYYLTLDPTVTVETDPRPALPTLFVDQAQSRIVAHTDWTARGTMFDYRASWTSINHQVGDGGQFELLRNGEWLTKEMSNYDSGWIGCTAPYHNTLALQNSCTNGTPSDLQWYESGIWANGGQWMEGSDAGDPSTVYSSGPGYVYASSDLTNLYNRPDSDSANAAISVTQATRSIMWLNGDFVVTYDRATTPDSGLFKRYNLCLVNPPTINGSVATEKMADGQQLFVQSLLPASPSLSYVNGTTAITNIAWFEPTQYILTIQDPSKPADTRFLTVVQGANAAAPMVPATAVASTSGTDFEGAVFGANAVFFPVDVLTNLTTTTFVAPASVTTLYVAGLAPNTSYGFTKATGVGGTTVTLGAGSNCKSDAAGVVTVSL